MVYVSILNQNEVSDTATYLNLRVTRSGGITVVPDIKIDVTDLNNQNGYKYKHFFNSGDGGVTIKVEIVILENDKINGVAVIDYLNNLYRNMLPVSLVSDAIDIPKDPKRSTYIITNISDKKQEKEGITNWSVEFTTYNPLTIYKYKNNNTAILNAIRKRKAVLAKKSTKTASTMYTKLRACNYNVLKYSKTKKVVDCVKYLQAILYKNKLLQKNQIDGWYGVVTKNAVKKYQLQYNKKYVVTNIAQKNSNGLMAVNQGIYKGNLNKTTVIKSAPKISKRLNVTGNVDKATWIALYKGE